MAKELGWKSRRLTMGMREQILNRITASKLTNRIDALREAKKALGDGIYEYFLGRYIKKITTLPENFFKRDGQIKIKINETLIQFGMSKTMPFPFYGAYGSTIGDLPAEHHLARKHYNNVDIQNAIDADRKEIANTVKPLLYTAKTEKHLLELWPGALQYLKPPIGSAAPPAPKCASADNLLAALDKVNLEIPA